MRTLLEILNNCVNEKKSYFSIFLVSTDPSKKIIVSKYSNIPNFDIQVTDQYGRNVLQSFTNLSPFDCFDMLRELGVEL